MNMGKQRKNRGQLDIPNPAVGEEVGVDAGELEGVVDFDRFLETIDDSSDSEDDDDEADPAEEDDNESDGSDNDDDDEDMEPEEEGEDLNEDEEEEEEEEESDEQENSDQGNEEEGEEGAPLQNGLGSEGSTSESEAEESGGAVGGKKELSVKKHKMDLQKLQDTDPEFFAFLKENDAELLDFNDSEADSDSDEEEALHKPPETLEEASDSEAEEERLDETSDEHKSKVNKNLKEGIVDINVISHWETQLTQTRDITVLTNVIDALQCAVHTLSQGETGTGMKWRVDGSANFNALLRLCIKQIKGFCVRFLCGNNNATVSESKFDQKPFDVRDKSKKWVRLRQKIKTYMEIIVKLFKCLGNPEAIAPVLRHTLRMSGFWALLSTKSYKMLQSLINIWSQGEDSCRVLAFLTIIRITNYCKDVFLIQMFKQMYISYVSNCKFTSVNSWPAINFMRSSLVELYLLDTALAYSVAFPFIRQLAIHLRNALSPSSVSQGDGKHKKGDASKVVYSWQFVHSLHLWVDVLSQSGSNNDDNLKLLVYPVVQICMGTVKLIPTKKYIPLRFHIVRMLIKLQERAGVFIPVLPLITEVLRFTDFSSKSAKKFSVRPIDLSVCLKSEESESGYTKAVSENAFETMLAYCKAIATDLGFPETVTPTVMYLRTFLKKQCRNIEVCKKFKTLLEKIDANSKYISDRRNKALEDGTVTLADKKSHKIFQVQLQTNKPHPPILEYATEYFKLNQKVQAKSRKPTMQTKEERLIPKPSAIKNSGKGQELDSSAFDKPMFKSDSEDEEFATKLEDSSVPLKQKKKRKLQTDDDSLEQTPSKKKVLKKGKSKKSKANTNVNLDSYDAQDELVDFELSD